MANYVLGIRDPNSWVSKSDIIGDKERQSVT